MKHLTYVLLTALLILGGCKNDDDNTPIAPIDQLPPATKFGANTAGCLVNGEVHLPNKRLTLNYLARENFGLVLSNEFNDISYKIIVFFNNTSFEIGQTYILNTPFNSNVNSRTGEYTIGSNSPPSPTYFTTNNAVTGELTITHHDPDKFIISGTFWFNAKNSLGEIVEVREGRFDMIYNI
ncbi:DUF6252 family protein [Algibacter sp. 2305UL17-15]|uniref:DUF6252 family protein n=1 Tax=Algibacter sp. 2305UL17-15 TaxID=3231268 RepID=UPI00345A862F